MSTNYNSYVCNTSISTAHSLCTNTHIHAHVALSHAGVYTPLLPAGLTSLLQKLHKLVQFGWLLPGRFRRTLLQSLLL